jgi:hypothetical protein
VIPSRRSGHDRDVLDWLNQRVVRVYVSSTKRRIQNKKILAKATDIGVGITFVLSTRILRWIYPWPIRRCGRLEVSICDNGACSSYLAIVRLLVSSAQD